MNTRHTLPHLDFDNVMTNDRSDANPGRDVAGYHTFKIDPINSLALLYQSWSFIQIFLWKGAALMAASRASSSLAARSSSSLKTRAPVTMSMS